MGVDIALYRARIGGFIWGNKVECGSVKKRHDSAFDKVWFSGLVLAIILVIGGVEVNPGPQADQAKIDQILAYVKNQEKDSKLIKQMVEAHKQEMADMRRGTDSLGPKFDQLSEMVTGMIKKLWRIDRSKELRRSGKSVLSNTT
jgi:hypothetical protein